MKHKFLVAMFPLLCVLLFSFEAKAQFEDIDVNGTSRTILAYAPSGIKPNSPLLISMHGMNQDIAYQQNQTKWEEVADDNGFVVVYPAGINNSWDIYGTSDIDFILAIIDEMASRYAIDRDRVYLSGFSMGGMMTYYAANHIADKIAAFAPVSGYLMQGPNTDSKRPIPIIHTHGTSDDVVGFGGVQTCLDAWIARNGCPTEAVVTKPYPADKTSSNATLHYWGKGEDDVEIVLLELQGVGHWHSNSLNGAHTSEEIWNFCKNYSLGFGVPEFELAKVTSANANQIQVLFSESIKEAESFEGFAVKINNEDVAIEQIELADTNRLAILLSNEILNTDDISLSYSDGNILSVYEKELEAFSDTLVENMLDGATPRLKELSISATGDTLFVKFNMEMELPADLSGLELKANYDGEKQIEIQSCISEEGDASVLCFTMGETVFADYSLTLTYTGSNIVSVQGAAMKTLDNAEVTNNSKGLPAYIESASIEANGLTLAMVFSKPMIMLKKQLDQFTLTVNGEIVELNAVGVSNETIKLTLDEVVHFGDIASITYTPGDIFAGDQGALEAFSDVEAVNMLSEPTWVEIPGKIEAEDYALQSGVSTETTSDDGGGINVGWIDTGDWLEYTIDNNTTDTIFGITFRFASSNSYRKLEVYVDDEIAGTISVPNTKDWQVWESVLGNFVIKPGKHYLKLHARSGGYNLNYFEFGEPDYSAIEYQKTNMIQVFPNPVSDELLIQTTGFKFNKIELIDITGKTIVQKTTENKSEHRMQLDLPTGIYFVKISNASESKLQKIVVQQK